MTFRRKNITISSSSGRISSGSSGILRQDCTSPPPSTPLPPGPRKLPPGTRPSPLNGHPTTSTGTPTLDALLSPHSALPLGTSFLIEEPGQTDFGSALLRYYAAEGITQGHRLIVIGCGENWVRDLPGVAESSDIEEGGRREKRLEDRMKIAWRYERLGEFGSGIGGSKALSKSNNIGKADTTATLPEEKESTFCHSFDLTKRLEIQSVQKERIHFIPLPPPFAIPPNENPFKMILEKLYDLLLQLKAATSTMEVFRVVVPNLLSPVIYPPHACQPRHTLQFIHSIRALLRTYSNQLSVMISFPLELYARHTALVRWIEQLCDGVLELTPLPQLMEVASHSAKGKEDIPQGLVKLWKLPLASERGGSGGSAGGYIAMGDDLAFTVTRKRFAIAAFSLPPLEDGEAAEDKGLEHNRGASIGDDGGHGHGKTTKIDLTF